MKPLFKRNMRSRESRKQQFIFSFIERKEEYYLKECIKETTHPLVVLHMVVASLVAHQVACHVLAEEALAEKTSSAQL